jgi:hypothetical protein
VGDKIEGFLEVGCNENGEIVVNHPDLKPDANGVGHIVFSPSQARNLATLLTQHAAKVESDARAKQEAERMKAAAAIPVDRSARVLTDGSPVTDDDHKELLPSGQQKGYVVLSAQERAKGFVRPFRDAYRHLKCGKITTMSRDISETYARDPSFYNGTFCTTCRAHFPIGENGEFTWYEMDGAEGPKVGT